MLQIALLLLGCALSRYLWEVSITIASVVLGVTSLGVLFYIFIVTAGAVTKGCPYQTPGSQAIRYLAPKVLTMGRLVASAVSSVPSALGSPFRKSEVIDAIIKYLQDHHPRRSRRRIRRSSRDLTSQLPPAFAADVYSLGRAVAWTLCALPMGAYRLVCGTRSWLLNRQAPAPNFRCISWTLQTSLDKPVRLSALDHLMKVTELTGLDPTLLADCLSILIGCVNSNNGKVVVMQGSEQLATTSASCLFLTFHHLLVTNPTSGIVADIRRRYERIFPINTNFDGLPPFHPVIGFHALVNQGWSPRNTRWADCRPSSQEHILFARHMVAVARLGHRRTQNRKVPRWTLRSALYSFSLDPPPPASIIADCLKIAAIDLGCDLLDITPWDEGYVFGFHGYSCSHQVPVLKWGRFHASLLRNSEVWLKTPTHN